MVVDGLDGQVGRSFKDGVEEDVDDVIVMVTIANSC